MLATRYEHSVIKCHTSATAWLLSSPPSPLPSCVIHIIPLFLKTHLNSRGIPFQANGVCEKTDSCIDNGHPKLSASLRPRSVTQLRYALFRWWAWKSFLARLAVAWLASRSNERDAWWQENRCKWEMLSFLSLSFLFLFFFFFVGE